MPVTGGQVILTLIVHRPGMWPSSLANTAKSPVTSLATNHIHFDVQNPTVYSIVWSREASLNTIPSIDVTKYTWRH